MKWFSIWNLCIELNTEKEEPDTKYWSVGLKYSLTETNILILQERFFAYIE